MRSRRRIGERRYRVNLKGTQCVYCGERADTKDHFPPYSWSSTGFLLPACTECNVMAGDRWPDNFEMRVKVVKESLRWKYRHVLKTSRWADAQLNDIGYTLRTAVEPWREQRKIMVERLDWSAEAYIVSIDHNNAFTPIIARRAAADSSRRILAF